MRYAVISDVHANLEALSAVLEELRDTSVDGILFLGDSVGYGPNPNECIEIIREIAKISLMGNHDSAVISQTPLEYFNPNALTAIEWTKEVINNNSMAFLRGLPIFQNLQMTKENPPSPSFVKGGMGGFLDLYLVHSTPKEPEQWHYLTDTQDAYINFHFFTERICLIGHTHRPAIIEQGPEGNIIFYRGTADFKDRRRYIINAGSVGQPRDGNPEACYAILNENSVEIKRVSYDILSTQKKMREAGLPLFLIERLATGR